MSLNLLIRRRMVSNQEVQEPTILGLVLTVMGFVLLLVVSVVAIAGLSAFGSIWWTFAAVAGILTWLVWGLRRAASPGPLSPTARQQWFGRIRRWARLLFLALLACWLGLIVWLACCPGGLAPPAKTDPTFIRVITWNLHCGQSEGPPWKQFDWPVRKQALRMALDQAQPDILCVQEATPEQVGFLEDALPGHQRVGIGRDGESGGEHCAIYFNRQRFAALDANTFWLEEPIDQPRPGSALDVKRICTWVRLRDRVSARTLRVYNTHLYLTESPRLTAARIILAHVAAGDRADAVLLTADFNATPSAPSRRLFLDAGLADSAERAGKPAGRPTLQLYGIGFRCIDGIQVDSHWRVENHLILDVKPRNTFPSDHFALLADLVLAE
jgi:endonuclease/exonuclease/phosphatase family metal-dependent hydrolase